MKPPLASVMICTHNRRALFARALRCYLDQDYPNKELVVVDSSADRVTDLLEDIPAVTYIHYPAKNLAEKRNIGVAAASGEFICNFDDDDWSGSHRLTDQVVALRENFEAQIAGYTTAYWWDEANRVASHYQGSMWGASICYRKSFAQANRWPESINLAEDAVFIAEATLMGLAVSMEGRDNFVATMHHGNAKRRYDGDFWPIVPVDQLPEAFRRAAGI